MAVTKLSCAGCRRTAVADIADESLVRGLIGWVHDTDGVWCLVCQARREGSSQLQRALRATADVGERGIRDSRRRDVEAYERRIQRLDELAYRTLLTLLITAAVVLVGVAVAT